MVYNVICCISVSIPTIFVSVETHHNNKLLQHLHTDCVVRNITVIPSIAVQVLPHISLLATHGHTVLLSSIVRLSFMPVSEAELLPTVPAPVPLTVQVTSPQPPGGLCTLPI